MVINNSTIFLIKKLMQKMFPLCVFPTSFTSLCVRTETEANLYSPLESTAVQYFIVRRYIFDEMLHFLFSSLFSEILCSTLTTSAIAQ